LSFQIIGSTQHLYDALRQGGRADRLLSVELDDRKFVASQASDRIGLPSGSEEAVGCGPEHQISRIVAKRVVDGLEVVQVNAEHGNSVIVGNTFQTCF